MAWDAKLPLGSQTPPPPPPAPKTGRFRRFLLYLILTSGLAYGGGIFLALKSDNFHDFFTEYVPYGEDSVLYFEERDFYRRFPNALRNQNRVSSAPKDAGSNVTISSKSGLKSKVTDEEQQSGADVTQKGPHMSSKPYVNAGAVEKTKSDSAAKEQAPKEDKKPAASLPTIQLAQMKEGGEAVVQDLVKTFNDIITVVTADDDSNKYSASISKAKEEVQKIGEKIVAVREEARQAAQDELTKIHSTFDESAREQIGRAHV